MNGGTCAFVDCHTHLLFSGCSAMDMTFASCRSTSELLGILDMAFQTRPSVLRGWNLNDRSFTRGLRPTIADISKISTTIPIFISKVGNGAALLNQAAFDAIGLSPSTPGLEFVDGAWTGWVWGEANYLALDFAIASLTDDEVARAAGAAADLCLQQGVTTLHAIEASFAGQAAGPRGRRNAALDRLRPFIPQMAIDVVPLDSQIDSPSDMKRIADSGERLAGGDFFLDGVLGAAYVPGMYRAALDVPYADGFGGKGHLLREDKVVRDVMAEGVRNGVSLGCHAVGERAIAQFLDCWEQVLGTDSGARGLRPRIDHGIIPRPADIKRAAELGVIFSMQPVFDITSGGMNGMYAERVGTDRVPLTHPFRELQDAGVVIVGGSDSPLNPIEPLAGIRGAVGHHFSKQRLTIEQAMRLFTANAAYAAHREKDTGTVETGKRADFAVLSDDPRTAEGLARCVVTQTWRNGQLAWSKQP
ncbi:amidohydrolase family protein (plasmid) [Agrobacterium tumefaciens]|nr:amidohydrolase family protein [Agrobacterium tumefaciens]